MGGPHLRVNRPRSAFRNRASDFLAPISLRIAEYKVDTDAAQPRLCVQFSERLAPGTVDWAQYFKVNGKDPQAVNAEARQICLDGFNHGRRYEVQVKAGLPSAIRGETLLKTAELAVYVKDRSPSVRATTRTATTFRRAEERRKPGRVECATGPKYWRPVLFSAPLLRSRSSSRRPRPPHRSADIVPRHPPPSGS